MVALKSTTPNLTEITSRYNKEHHHTDDEVRLTVEGEGVFVRLFLDKNGWEAIYNDFP
jgi:1,2-dihydroxy-3-keto-5-methylthiopentene dioxygenase